MTTEERWRRWDNLLRAGKLPDEVARSYRVHVSTVRRGVARVRALDAKIAEELDEVPPLRDLVLDFGRSTKPFAQVTCLDIHSCNRCGGSGAVVELVEVEAELVEVVVECGACRGSGLVSYPPGSRLCCADCHRTGVDHLPDLVAGRRPPPERRTAQPTSYARGDLRGGLG